MKILHVIPSVATVRGGPSTAVIEMVKSLQKADCDVEIATTNDNGETLLDVPLNCLQDYQGVPVRFFARFSPQIHAVREFAFSLGLTQWLWRYIQDYDLVHVHAIFSYSSTVAMAIARWQNVPYIVRPLGQLCQWSLQQSSTKKNIYLNLIERKNINSSAGLHLTSETERQESEELNFKCSKFVIPHGLTPPALIPEAGQRLRDHFQLPPQQPIILFLSRIHPKKGLEILINALAELKTSKFTLIIAGSGDPDYEDQIKSCLQVSGLTNRALMTGFVAGEFKQLLLQGSDLFALTSYSENFGVAVLEALVAGTPTLLTPGVALAQKVEQNELGYVVPQDPTAIGEAIKQHFGRSESEREKLSQKARQFVLDNYAWEKIAQEMLAVYQSILGISS